MVTGLVVM